MDEPHSPLRDQTRADVRGDAGDLPAEVDGGTDADVPDRAEESLAAIPVEVAVKRSGGFAGLTRHWQADPPPAEASQWIELISNCPWDAAPAVPPDGEVPAGDDPHPPRGADRFTWWIRARCGEEPERETELPDDEVVGAWRELVDAVRAWGRPDD
ncbi:protealysin inhibitor emfourin [Microbacterium sulfonylureivorans]|uniref:protealysin inhibitor emfourin n=1 Tax=Microbacterium sulfonylureivorans TaxID=2486854 RepID=UPI001F0C093F|nr:protealysin inhibitor emfourin [Microbacterium sulfonylureivorans]